MKRFVENQAPARTPSQQAVLEALAWAADEHGHGARLSYRRIAEKKQLHRNTVLRALRELELEDRIRRHRGRPEGPPHCSQCASARRGTAVYDVVMPAAREAVADGQLNLLAGVPDGPSERPADRHPEVPVSVPVTGTVQHHHGASSGTMVVPLEDSRTGSSSASETRASDPSGGLRELVDRTVAILERVEKPGWFVDRIGVEAHVLTWSAHKDPLRAAAAVVAGARDHHHLNAAKLLGRALEWQRLDAPPSTSRPSRPSASGTADAGELPDRYRQYDVAIGLAG